MDICFIGSGSHANNDLDEVYLELSSRMNRDAKILIIPFATDASRYEGWLSTIKAAFSEMEHARVDILNENLTEEEMKQAINEHDVLYFIGGSPERLITLMEKKRLTPILKSFKGLLIGYSAGSLAFCTDCIITKDKDYPETIVVDGLALVTFSVEVHYENQIDAELLPLSSERKIYALPDGSALFTKNGEPSKVVKAIYCFQNGTRLEKVL
ncbi:Type 1 glutamine amidotransferase-like domain-containing protein [Peribacillus sp. SI8-4]|uniref:Type 1 glutamine amidotransferase-like domain-containing protein n=1 Tax=Peribacillus sp. SI8-4 TaxID=3048009 RepID=UPI002552BE61|nr:Type 1 glutamine amidotransferase-like domain-containing protein [Peribacillus sp. SI8-4]